MEPFFAFPPPYDFALLREAARALRATADTVGSAGDLLTGTGRVPPEDFEGDAGRAYRTATDELASDAELLGGDLRALGAALDEFAGWAEEVRAAMLTVHEVADAHGIARDGYWRSLPPAPTGDQTVLFHTLRNRAAEADGVLRWAEDRWAAALEDHAGVRPTGAPMQNHPPPAVDWPPRDWPGRGPLSPAPAPTAPREPLTVDPSAPVDRPGPEHPGGGPAPDGHRDAGPGRSGGDHAPAPTAHATPPAGTPLTPAPPPDAPPPPAPRPAPPVPDLAEAVAHDLTGLLR